MRTDRTHFVYQAYDADGLLLYIGCTGNPTQRYRSHMAGQHNIQGWFHPFVTSWRVSGPYPKKTALTIEKAWIDERQPIWNGHSRGNRYPDHKLINEYMAFHEVRFHHSGLRGDRAVLMPAAAA